MCAASGDVGWFSVKHKSQGQHLYVKHGTSVQRRGFWQADLHHAQYRCIHTPLHRHQINTWRVTKRIWRRRSKQQYLEVWIEDACWWLGHYSNYTFYSNCKASIESTFLLKHPFSSTDLLWYDSILNLKIANEFLWHIRPPRRKEGDWCYDSHRQQHHRSTLHQKHDRFTKAVVKHDKYPLQNTQKKNRSSIKHKTWPTDSHTHTHLVHQSWTHVQYHSGMWGWHLKNVVLSSATLLSTDWFTS